MKITHEYISTIGSEQIETAIAVWVRCQMRIAPRRSLTISKVGTAHQTCLDPYASMRRITGCDPVGERVSHVIIRA